MSAIKVVTALIIRDGSVLMCERSRKKYLPLHWEFPGGKVEAGESLTGALVREVREELHIDIDDPKEYFQDIMSYSNGHTYDVTFFSVREYRGEPVNTEFEDLLWVTPEIMPTLLHLAGNKQVIAKLLREGFPAS